MAAFEPFEANVVASVAGKTVTVTPGPASPAGNGVAAVSIYINFEYEYPSIMGADLS